MTAAAPVQITPDTLIALPASTLDAVSSYLADRPFKEAAPLLQLLGRGQVVTPAEPGKSEDKTPEGSKPNGDGGPGTAA